MKKDENADSNVRSNIKNKILVMSGKGGVGKSTTAVNLAVGLHLQGFKVGLLDADIHGPSIPTMFGSVGTRAGSDMDGLLPVEVKGIKLMSVGFLLEHPDQPIIYRGPAKAGLIKQFIHQVHWGDLDYLIIDSPPGTGDEPLSVCQLIEDLSGVIIVTTPQEVSLSDVRKSIQFCNKLEIKILGIIENMKGFVCPHCQTVTDIFPEHETFKQKMVKGIPVIGEIPVDPSLGKSGDSGIPAVLQSETSSVFKEMVKIIQHIQTKGVKI